MESSKRTLKSKKKLGKILYVLQKSEKKTQNIGILGFSKNLGFFQFFVVEMGKIFFS